MHYSSKENRTSIINSLIVKFNYKTYLEIGVDRGDNFRGVQCKSKESVDPVQLGFTTHVTTSDEFFRSRAGSRAWDLIFIDGLHHYDQCYRDIKNSLDYLSPGGTVVCHDMGPNDPNLLIEGGAWTGDVFRSFVRMRQEKLAYGCLLENCDYGVAVIQKDNSLCQDPGLDWQGNPADLSYETWTQEKNRYMNCVTAEDFLARLAAL